MFHLNDPTSTPSNPPIPISFFFFICVYCSIRSLSQARPLSIAFRKAGFGYQKTFPWHPFLKPAGPLKFTLTVLVSDGRYYSHHGELPFLIGQRNRSLAARFRRRRQGHHDNVRILLSRARKRKMLVCKGCLARSGCDY